MSGYERIKQYAESIWKAERERDEAILANGNAEVRCTEALEMAEKLGERLQQAAALLRDARAKVGCDCFGDGEFCCQGIDVRGRIDAFLAGPPAPVKLAVDDAMVERFKRAFYTDTKNDVRAALVAALEGKS